MCLSVLPLMHSIFICLAWLYIYSGNCPKVYSWQCMQWIHVHHTCIHCGGVCSIYVGFTHILALVVVVWVELVLIWTSSFVLLDHIKYNLLYTTYSRISCVLVSNIHYINPLIVIVINYQNGGDCKGILPLCVVLVINDNPYGLMFSLSLYEGIFHRYYL